MGAPAGGPPPPEDAIAALLAWAEGLLAPIHDSPRLDAEVLLAHVLDRPRHYVYAWPEHRPSAAQAEAYRDLIHRRAAGEPVAYLTGEREFWSLALRVSPATLIPRPETELLVELALERFPADTPVRVADLGTGSGAIALALARERPAWHLVATDVSPAALAVARDNATRLDISNVEFRPGDWFGALTPPPFDGIVANPPYVRDDDPHLLRGDPAREPPGALCGGVDGLDAVRRIATGARPHLVPGGWLAMEHGHDQGAGIRDLLAAEGFGQIRTHRDLAGLERATAAVRVD